MTTFWCRSQIAAATAQHLAGRLPALFAKAPIFDRGPSSPSPFGSRPCGSRSGAERYGRSPSGDRRHSLRPRHAVRVSRRRCARIPFHALLRRLSGSRRRIRRHAGTRPSGAQAENRPSGPTVSTATRRSLRFSACPALSPVCFLGPATAAPKGMERWGRASLPPTMMDPVLVGPGFFVGRATARHFNAPAHQRGSDFSQENNEIDQI